MKIVNPHMVFNLNDHWCGCDSIEVHDKFAIAYWEFDRNSQRQWPITTEIRFFDNQDDFLKKFKR